MTSKDTSDINNGSLTDLGIFLISDYSCFIPWNTLDLKNIGKNPKMQVLSRYM